MDFDVVIVGGGPAGLAAALTLGRARRRVLLCDSGPRRNAAAERVHNFVTRDGTPPDEFRGIAREQLTHYPNVTVRDDGVGAITGERDAFRVETSSDTVLTRRVLLCVGMIDETLPLEGFRELWGHGIYQCPYCHGWEVQDRRWGYLARPDDAAHMPMFAQLVRVWTDDVVVFTNGAFEVDPEIRARFESLGIGLETRAIARLVAEGTKLSAIELRDGTRVARDVLFTHPPQRQVELVTQLGLALDEAGFVRVDPMSRVTSVPGIYAAGDLITRMQSAIAGAAAGVQAASMITVELALSR